MLAIEMPILAEYIIDIYDELHNNREHDEVKILFEGAQGFGLDVDWGEYPFVTSSHCTVGSAVLNGVPPRAIRDAWGVSKIYETYVGAKEFHGIEEVLEEIRDVGQEYGATTGRARQINWLDMDLLTKAARINGVNKLVMNKVDVLEQVDYWKLYEGMHALEFQNGKDMKNHIETSLKTNVPGLEVLFSGNKECI